MKKIIFTCLFLFGLLPYAFAEEKVVDGIVIDFGVISWADIQDGSKGKPATHTEEYHRRMAKAMSEMHGSGGKGEYHVMVMLKDKETGGQIRDAHVRVIAAAQTGPEKISHELKSMSMDGYSGYGEFFKLTFTGLYVFQIKINRESMVPLQGKTYTVEIERTIPTDK